jgi:hypothetical protein
MERRWKFALPKAEELLRIVQNNIVYNFRAGHEAKVQLQPLIQRAYNIVNETGVIPYRDYSADATLTREQ